MQTIALHADARADTRADVRGASPERRLARYQPRFRKRVHALAARHARLKDLAVSFPALLLALAVPRFGFDPEAAIARVIDGAPLRELQALTGVTSWLRRFPPEAFGAPLPRLPDTEFVGRQIVNHCPQRSRDVTQWLRAVSDAWSWCDEGMSVWIARELTRHPRLVKLDQLHFVCLWAWYAKHQPQIGTSRIGRRWSHAMQFDVAVKAADSWWQTVHLHVALGQRSISDMWLQPGRAGSYKFVPLRSGADILEEGLAMGSCLPVYGKRVATHLSRLWSVRKEGFRVATLEIGFRRNEPLPDIVQLRLAQNKDAPREVWLAARQWLNAQDLTRVERDRNAGAYQLPDRSAWLKQWRPYWLAKRRIPPWLPLTPAYDTMEWLRAGPPNAV